jgi:hypothetical protein
VDAQVVVSVVVDVWSLGDDLAVAAASAAADYVQRDVFEVVSVNRHTCKWRLRPI